MHGMPRDWSAETRCHLRLLPLHVLHPNLSETQYGLHPSYVLDIENKAEFSIFSDLYCRSAPKAKEHALKAPQDAIIADVDYREPIFDFRQLTSDFDWVKRQKAVKGISHLGLLAFPRTFEPDKTAFGLPCATAKLD